MACKRSGVRIPIAPLPVQGHKFEQMAIGPPRSTMAWSSTFPRRPSTILLVSGMNGRQSRVAA